MMETNNSVRLISSLQKQEKDKGTGYGTSKTLGQIFHTTHLQSTHVQDKSMRIPRQEEKVTAIR